MAEASRFMFTYKEVVAALIKEQNIHEGIWGLIAEFGLAAASFGADDDQLAPTAIVPLQKIGIQRSEKLTNLTVDAAVINPLPSKKRSPVKVTVRRQGERDI